MLPQLDIWVIQGTTEAFYLSDLHLRLKIEVAQRRTTIGELIEELVEKYIK